MPIRGGLLCSELRGLLGCSWHPSAGPSSDPGPSALPDLVLSFPPDIPFILSKVSRLRPRGLSQAPPQAVTTPEAQ